ncbi:unnamed protein product [Ostreobium quekettii]|uniref:Metallopeptidase n=1 Tax=Ostreobium quekettii TaxID=121088 RepID=A0A8S1J177_9CHLO|nr:unnamed protein product [Ostreobium quekettii]|eukprot:evm.model.scf_1144EXC.4 EVM.evm.TU.scf_1144EXC.4   scf_1144EXC:45261-46877(+)
MKRWLACACLALLTCAPVGGQRNAAAEDREVDDFILGNTVFWLYHEMGHALVRMLELPVVGREEDAVDGFGVVRMIAKGSGNGSDAALLAAARGWRLFNDMADVESVFWGVHSLDLQRYYAIVCLLVGSDPEGWRQLAVDAGVPEERIDECPGEYELMRGGWERLLAPHAPTASASASNVRSGRSDGIRVTYDRPRREGDRRLQTLIQDSGLVEAAVDDVLSLAELPAVLRVRFGDCQQDGFFDPVALEVRICYSLLAMFRSFVRNDVADRSEDGARGETAVFIPGLSFDEETVALFVLGNTVFAVYHELATALIHDLDLPIVVGESNAADSFAAVLMIPEGPGEPLADELVIEAANGWYLTGLALGEKGGEVTAWSGDDVNLQRYYDVICLFVGSDRRGLMTFERKAGLPRDRARWCGRDYEMAVLGWRELLRPHASSGASGPGVIDVVHEEASGEGNRNLRDLVRDSGVVEAAADSVLSLVDLPRDLQVVIKDCEGGDSGDETFFDVDGGRVVVCHRFLARLEALIREDISQGKGL